jgi:hypothetical protein
VTIDNNRIRELDLDGLTKLEKLHCNGNPLLTIRNFPDTIHDFLMENNPTLQLLKRSENNDQMEQVEVVNVEVEDAIKQYYDLKTKYEQKMSSIKKSIYDSMSKKKQRDERIARLSDAKYPCVKCGRLVNTIFSNQNRILKAMCGDREHPCNLNIEIDAGFYIDLKNTIVKFSEDLEDRKENIIKIKMDSLFGYRTDKSAVRKFNKEFEEYESSEKILKNMSEIYDKLYFDDEKNEKIKQKSKQIFDLQEEMKRLLKEYEMKKTQIRTDGEIQKNMEDIMALYTQQLLPEYKNLQTLKYDHIEMYYEHSAKIITFPLSLSKQNYRVDEKPTVKHFTVL